MGSSSAQIRQKNAKQTSMSSSRVARAHLIFLSNFGLVEQKPIFCSNSKKMLALNKPIIQASIQIARKTTNLLPF